MVRVAGTGLWLRLVLWDMLSQRAPEISVQGLEAQRLNPRCASPHGAASTHNVGYGSSRELGLQDLAMQRITPDQTHPLFNTEATCLEQAVVAQLAPRTPDAACWSGWRNWRKPLHRMPARSGLPAAQATTVETGLEVRTICPRWAQSRHQLAGTTETLPPDARQSWKARHQRTWCGPTRPHRSDRARPVH